MRRVKCFATCVVVACCMGLLSGTAFGEDFVFTTLDVPGASQTSANGINDGGAIVGDFFDASGMQHGFLRDPGTGNLTTLDVPGAFFTQANDINNGGAIVGLFNDVSGRRGFLRDPGTGNFTALAVPGASLTQAEGINDGGAIVGLFVDASGQHGFLRDPGGNFNTLDVGFPGSFSTSARGINGGGAIVGDFFDASGRHGVLADPAGNLTILDVPGLPQTIAKGINDGAAIVGEFFLRDPAGNFTILDFLTVDFPGLLFADAFDINDVGAFVGHFDDPSSIQHGFFAVTVMQALEDVVSDVITLNLIKGIQNSLDVKLDAAMMVLDDVNQNNDVAACGSIGAFTNAVEAQRGNGITDEEADDLISDIQAISTALGCL